MATKIRKNIKTCKAFWPASADFVNSATVFVNFATVFVNSATPRGHAPAALAWLAFGCATFWRQPTSNT